MAPHNQNNTIDFDAAKLQRLQLAEQRLPPKRPVSVAELRHRLNLQLQSSLECDRILGVFFHEIQAVVPVDYLGYQHSATELRLEFGESAAHSAQYRLSHNGEYLGQLTFRRRQRLSENELSQLESLIAALLYPLRNALLYRTAILSALRDPLTGTGNRVAMEQALSRDVELARRSLMPLSVLMVDLDHFKRVNDDFGHAFGDEALRSVAQALKASLRNVDMVFRYGGEEFLVLLSNTAGVPASQVGERLRHAVQDLDFRVEGQAVPLSISLGCATLAAGESAEDLLRRADSALYAAKRDGRNRLACA